KCSIIHRSELYAHQEHPLFFFQAEDGIRDYKVTGVQTCALPIFSRAVEPWPRAGCGGPSASARGAHSRSSCLPGRGRGGRCARRSEERRVGKECRSRGSLNQGEKIERETGKNERCARDGI